MIVFLEGVIFTKLFCSKLPHGLFWAIEFLALTISMNSNVLLPWPTLSFTEFTHTHKKDFIYLLISFVHFLSSLDLSELAKAAKKKLQSVSISIS